MNKIMLSMVLMLLTVASVNAQEIYGNAFFSYELNLDADNDFANRSNFVIDRAVAGVTDDFSNGFSGAVGIELDDEGVRPRDVALFYEHKNFYASAGLIEPYPNMLGERVWGYRAILPTIQNLNGIVPNREFGLSGVFNPTSNTNLGVMVTNGEPYSFTNDDNYHRVYAQFAGNTTNTVFGAGLSWQPNDSSTEDVLVGSIDAALVTDSYRFGAEAYSHLNDALDSDYGVSVFGSVEVSDTANAVARVDYSNQDQLGTDELMLLGAVSFQPTSNVRLIPNVIWRDNSSFGRDLTLRLTTAFDLNN